MEEKQVEPEASLWKNIVVMDQPVHRQIISFF